MEQNNRPKILVTGAAGFIGSNFLRYLFDKYPEYYFLVLDALTYAGSQKNIPDYIKRSNRYEFWHGDITNVTMVNELMSRADFVVHLAAETHVARSIFDNYKFFQTDVIGTQTLMNALIKCPNVKRFIHVSSSEVYGTALTEPMDENHPLNPQSPYAGAKAGADRLVYSYWSTYDVPVVIFRPFNNYGPQQHLEKMVPRFITAALKNESLTIHGDGSARRDWLYVEDHCQALDEALHTKDFNTIKNQVINIGTGVSLSTLEIAQIIIRELNRSEKLMKLIGDRPGQVRLHLSSTAKAKKTLLWEAKVDFTAGLKKTIAWYRDNESWWKEMEWMRQVPIRTTTGAVEMH